MRVLVVLARWGRSVHGSVGEKGCTVVFSSWEVTVSASPWQLMRSVVPSGAVSSGGDSLRAEFVLELCGNITPNGHEQRRGSRRYDVGTKPSFSCLGLRFEWFKFPGSQVSFCITFMRFWRVF
jgi:hypothetical protein